MLIFSHSFVHSIRSDKSSSFVSIDMPSLDEVSCNHHCVENDFQCDICACLYHFKYIGMSEVYIVKTYKLRYTSELYEL